MSRGTVTCCHNCPDRVLGCHSTCDRYIKAVEANNIKKEKEKAMRNPIVYKSSYLGAGSLDSKRYRQK